MAERVVDGGLALAVVPITQLADDGRAVLGGACEHSGGVLDLQHGLVRPACARQPAPGPLFCDDQLATARHTELGTMSLSDLDVLDEAEHVRVPGNGSA